MSDLRDRHENISTHYDRVTPAWEYLLGEENLHYGLFLTDDESLDAATKQLTIHLAESLNLSQGLGLIDIGCGVGGPACLLATEYGVNVIGISTSEVGLRLARERAHRAGLGQKITFRHADATANGIASATFDRAWIMESSHLMEDKSALMMETARVMRPGGRLILCDIIRRTELPISEIMKRGKDFKLLQMVFGRAKMETLDFYRRIAEEAGLRIVRTEDISEETRPTFRHWRENAYAHRADVEKDLGYSAWEKFVSACDVLDDLWSKEILGYGILLAEKPA